MDIKEIEKSVQDSLLKMHDKSNTTLLGIENSKADQTNLMAKIDKKRAELDRAEKRLKSLQGVR